LEKVFNDLGDFNGICILPPSPRKMGTYVPSKLMERAFELEAITFSNLLEDTHTALALQTCLNLVCTTIYLAGYDGYGGVEVSQREIELFNENELQFDLFVKETKADLISVTTTKYKNLKKSSVYSF
jgi:4-hydroxy 2-oxovalerate aldolase